MYQEEIKPNPTILRKYILVGVNSPEWLVRMYECPQYLVYPDNSSRPDHMVLAVYEPTGRVFKDGDRDSPAWEYEYKGIRVI